jgi:CheY-like chemotaxis protein
MSQERDPANGSLDRERGSRPRRILLAEDDSPMRALLARNLRGAGFDVVEASSGYEIFDRLAHTLYSNPAPGFDLIISDVRMPGYDGLNVIASLRQLPVSIPVILITAFPTTTTRATAARLGAFALLEKPFDLDDLVALARSATGPHVSDEDEP